MLSDTERRALDALGGHVQYQNPRGPCILGTLLGQPHKLQFLFGAKQGAFSGEPANYKTGDRRAPPLLKVMLNLGAVNGAGVIERRRDRRQYAL